MKVLVIEDEPRIVRLVTFCLKGIWAQVEVLSTSAGERGVELVNSESPAFAILDLGLPDISGFEVLQRIRSFSAIPIIIVTGRDAEGDKIKGLELGADDYIVKPFSPGELVARVRAVLRRSQVPVPQADLAPSIQKRLKINYAAQEVSIEGKPVKLAPSAYMLLCHLVENEGKFLPVDMLLETLTGKRYTTDDDYVGGFITYLRNKLEEKPAKPKVILGDSTTGYKFVGQVDQESRIMRGTVEVDSSK